MSATITTIHTTRARELAAMDLDSWDQSIDALNLALTDAAVARDKISELTRLLDVEEARALLGASGGNAETRKAAVLLALNEACPVYENLQAELRERRLRLADAERRVIVAKQQGRLLQTAIKLQMAFDEEDE